jgi:predicted ATPase
VSFVRAVELVRERAGEADAYPWSLPVVRGLQRLELDPGVTFLVGENGSGKSTLIEALAVCLGLNPEGGTQNFAFATHESHSPLHEALRPVREARRPRTAFFLRAESLFTVATEIERLDKASGEPLLPSYGGRSLHERSHGESFLALANNRFSGDGLYLFDEPEAALSPHGLLALMRRMADLLAERSQFVIATHSPILMAFPGATIYECGPDGLERADYDDLDHVRLTRSFLEDPQRFLRHLLDDD